MSRSSSRTRCSDRTRCADCRLCNHCLALRPLAAARERARELSLKTEHARADQLIDYFFNQPFVGMAIVAPGTQKFVKFNEQACVLTGYSSDELRTMTWRDITHPDDMEQTFREVMKIRNRETDAISYEQRLVRKDGFRSSTSIPMCSACATRTAILTS